MDFRVPPKDKQRDSQEEIRAALTNYRNEQFSTWLTIVLGLAAETHPEELKAALAHVFDLSGVEDYCKRIMLTATRASEMSQQARELAQAINTDLDKIEARIDAMHYALGKVKT